VDVDPDKMLAARQAGASPWEVHERAFVGESLGQSRTICTHSSEPCRGDCAPIAAAAYHLTPAPTPLSARKQLLENEWTARTGELVDSK